jgi:hypothetical protein
VKTRFVAMLGLLLALGLLTPFTAGSRVLAQEPVDCRGLQEYVDQYHAIGQSYQLDLSGLDTSNLENWTPEEFAQAQAAVGEAITGIEALTPLPIVTEMQAQAIESLQLFQEMLTAIDTDGIFAALPYIDQMTAASDELDAIVLPIEEHCNVAILDNDDDGTPEVGAGAELVPEIDPSAPLGAYNNPYPVGTAAATEGGWSIQVDSVTPDGTQAVLDENSFNEEPEAGRQFFIATITATNNGTATATFDGNFRLRVRGADGTVYTAFGDACGVTPNEWDQNTEVAPGQSLTGNLCWSVPADQLANLRMFDKEAENTTGLMYWSLGQDSV